MNVLNLTKAEVKYLFLTVAMVPVLSLLTGFYVSALVFSDREEAIHASINPVPELQSTPAPVERVERYSVEEPSVAVIGNESPAVELTANEQRVAAALPVIPAAPVISTYVIQAGLFANVDNARKLSTQLKQQHLDARIIDESAVDSHQFRVIVGSFDSEALAREQLKKLKREHPLDLYLTTLPSLNSSNVLAAI